MLSKSLRPFGTALVAAAAVLAAACGSRKEPAPSGPPPDAKRVDESRAGTVAGRILIEGAPQNAAIKMSSDPVCAGSNKAGAAFETFAVSDGGLDNVFVYIKDGLGNYYFDVPTTPARLDQQGCRYHPHVFGMRVGQPLEIVNSDETLHNVHAIANVNQEFNFGQPMKGMAQTKTFTVREVMVPFKCDVHSWMNAYAGVLDHPYFAVTAEGGRFALKNVPAGTYTIEAWHEKLGTQTQSVTLGEKENKQISFTFKAGH